MFDAGTKITVATTASTLKTGLAGSTFYVGECFEEEGATVARLFLNRKLALGEPDWDGIRLPSAILPLSLLLDEAEAAAEAAI